MESVALQVFAYLRGGALARQVFPIPAAARESHAVASSLSQRELRNDALDHRRAGHLKVASHDDAPRG
jgi:hypothetical protein